MLSFSANPGIDQQQQQQQQNNQLASQLATQLANQQNAALQQSGQPAQPGQTMRLRDEPPPITPATRPSRKRKSPPSNQTNDQQPPPQPQPPPQQQPPPPQMHHILPPPHAMIHPMQPGQLPPGYSYGDYTPGGMPQNVPQPPQDHQQHSQSPPPNSAAGRALSSSKRAEQNRKAQRAFRERRDQHVKALESRSQLLDAALASADEANRRWEECRALVDQLRVENAALRAALSQAQLLPPGIAPQQPGNNPNNIISNNGSNGNAAVQNNGAQEGVKNPEAVEELKTDSAEASQEQKHE